MDWMGPPPPRRSPRTRLSFIFLAPGIIAMPRPNRTLRLEQLEDRRLLTAVVAPVVNGVVQITGGDGADQVSVRQLDLDSFKIRGDVAGGSVVVNNVNKIAVDMNGGDDQLFMNGIAISDPNGGWKHTLPGGLDIDMGGGSDTIRVKVLDVKGHVDIRSNGGSTDAEIIHINNSYWGGGADIATGDGADQIVIDGAARLRGNVNIDTGFSDSDVDDYVFLGENEFGQLTVNLHGGNDTLEMYRNTFNADALFDGDDGDGDLAAIRGNDFGAGMDFLNFEGIIPLKKPKEEVPNFPPDEPGSPEEPNQFV
jgi:hypothetical protein